MAAGESKGLTWRLVCLEIMCKIGELFLLRTNINSVGSVLDSPVRIGGLLNVALDLTVHIRSSGSVLGIKCSLSFADLLS